MEEESCWRTAHCVKKNTDYMKVGVFGIKETDTELIQTVSKSVSIVAEKEGFEPSRALTRLRP